MQNMMKNSNGLPRRLMVASAAAVSSVALVLSGCSAGMGGSTATTAAQLSLSGLHGKLHGGQNAIAGATIQLYQIANGAPGTAAIPLLPTSGPGVVLTSSDGAGSFSITGLYTCAPGSKVYLTGTGGAPGMTAPVNPQIALMDYLGDCATLQANAANISVTVNEITTVAAVYALAGYMTGYATASYSGTSVAGLNNAFTTASVLASPYIGTSPGAAPTAGITFPSANINTLADIISGCINSAGGYAGDGGSSCGLIFGYATAGSSVPTDTIGALLNIAHNPSVQVGNIYYQIPSHPPFGPYLTGPPADWTMAVKYTGGGLSSPSGIAIDATGNAWVANGSDNAVTEITAGGFASGSAGYASPFIAGAKALAIDSTGNIWLANAGANNLLELSSAGAITNTITSGIAGPNGVAIDSSNNVWVSNFDGNSVSAYSNSGTPLAFSPITNAALSAPTGIAIDGLLNYIWVGSSATNQIALFNSTTGAYINGATDGLLVAPGGVVTDLNNSGKAYTAATGINSLMAVGAVNNTPTYTELTQAALAMPLAVAVDGNSNVWTVSDVTAGSISGFTSTLTAITPAAGLSTLNAPSGVAIDSSGNLWTADSGDSSVTEFVGLAGPTVTPLVASPR